jgi:MFS superfamily sulfate permease-like transporter
MTGADPRTARAAYAAMGLIASTVIVPLCLAALATGVVQSLAGAWGLFRNYWVVVKPVLTVFTTGVLLLQLEPIRYVAEQTAQATFTAGDLVQPRRSLIVHAAGGLIVLLITTVLSVYKPPGLTRCGWRKKREQAAAYPGGPAG